NLPLRGDFTTGIFHAQTDQTLTDGQFGSAVTAVAIAPDQDGDADVAFYSAPLTTAGPALTTSDTASADLWIGNLGNSDITVTCAATYLDYDPATGQETPFAATLASSQVIVPATDVASCTTASTAVQTDTTVPAGHLLKLLVTVHFVNGDAAQLQY